MKTPKEILEQVDHREFAAVNGCDPKHSARDRRRFIKKIDAVSAFFEKLGFKLSITKLRK